MKVAERRFTRDSTGWIHIARNLDAWILCGYIFDKLFDVPDNVHEIWLSLHTSRATNRVIAKIKTNGSGKYPKIHISRTEFERHRRDEWQDFPPIDRAIMPFIGRPLYLQCEYKDLASKQTTCLKTQGV